MDIKKKITKFFVFCFSFVAISVAYQNCGSPSGAGGGGVGASNTANGDIIPIPNTKTASVQRASRVLDQMVSCLGTGAPSNNARNAWNTNRGTISEEGLANSMTQPMAKTLVTVASEVCEDLMDQERGLASDQRRIFIEIDFNSGDVSRGDLVLASKRIARSCWGRNATDDEINLVVNDIVDSFSSSNDDRNDDGNATRRKAVYMCTAMASSFAAFEM